MEIIEISAGVPDWFWFVYLPIAVMVILAMFGVDIGRRVKNKNATFWPSFSVLFILGFVSLHVGISLVGHISGEEKERLVVEVSEVVGFEIGTGEVDLMLDSKPVRDITYVRSGDTFAIDAGKD